VTPKAVASVTTGGDAERGDGGGRC